MGEGQPASIAAYYHAETKYTPDGMRRMARSLDWASQPPSFKAYPEAEEIDLRRYMPTGTPVADDSELERWRHAVAPEERALAELAHLLYFTNGVTAVVPQPNEPFLMRAAPSAGGLYPTEIYVLAREGGPLPGGAYHYQVRQHALAKLEGPQAWSALEAACFQHPGLAEAQVVLVLTGFFARSAWRYEDRAYRRVLLDTGHVLGNLLGFGWALGWAGGPIAGFADDAVSTLLGLSTEEEGPLVVVPLRPQAPEGPPQPRALPGPSHEAQKAPPGARLNLIHAAGCIPAGDPPAMAAQIPTPKRPSFGAPVALPREGLDWGPGIGMTILRRRSTRRFSGEGISLKDFASMLAYTHGLQAGPGEAPGETPSLMVPELVESYVVVHEVEGLEAGCYRYDPEAHALTQVRFTALRREAHHLALGQDLAASCAAMVVHAADLDRAVKRYGDRAYRYLHLDAGHLGQRLNLAAVALDLGASGIGGFFDDEVNETLGLPAGEAVLYLTTLGVPDHEHP